MIVNEIPLLKTIQRKRDFVVAEAIRLKAGFFPAYRERHPQSAAAVLAGVSNHSMYWDIYYQQSLTLRHSI